MFSPVSFVKNLRSIWPVAGAIAAVSLIAAIASAAPPPNADGTFAPWFQSLRQPGTGISCCSMADCRATEYRTNASGYEAFIEDRWLAVPADRVLDHTENPTGRAIVCYMPGRGILCFVRPAET